MRKTSKRLFIAFRIQAPWPKETFPGRLIAPNMRHITIAFLGQTEINSYEKVKNELAELFKLDHPVWGYFDAFLPLPSHETRVLSWHAHFYQMSLYDFVEKIKGYLVDQNLLKKEDKKWLPHVSIARKPFHYTQWKKAFKELPFFSDAICVYESLGNLQYKPVLEVFLPLPFKELSDGRYLIYGKSFSELLMSAQLALSFKGLPCFNYSSDQEVNSLSEIKSCIENRLTLMKSNFSRIDFLDKIENSNPLLSVEMSI